MKIAVITEDGKTISKHFGRAPYYLVFDIEDQKISGRQMLEKLGHNHFAPHGDHDHHHDHSHSHEPDPAAHNKHTQMANAIQGCQAVICGGMGMGAYQSMRMLNIQPVVTDLDDAEEAALAYAAGNLKDHTELLH